MVFILPIEILKLLYCHFLSDRNSLTKTAVEKPQTAVVVEVTSGAEVVSRQL